MAGTIRKPGSVRDVKEHGARTAYVNDPTERLDAPTWLTSAANIEFQNLVKDLTAANVPLKQADTNGLAMAASCIANVAVWTKRETDADNLKDQLKCSVLVARYQADFQKWVAVIGASPKARAQIGVQAVNKTESNLERLLKAKLGT
jgi:hypothetical protein